MSAAIQESLPPGMVTVVVRRIAKPGSELELEKVLHGVLEVATKFPGHAGANVFRPQPGSREYVLVFRFDHLEHLMGWEDSPERAEWVARADKLCVKSTITRASGMEAWFETPPGALPPPRWKMAVLSWMVAFPVIQILGVTLVPALSQLPALLRGAIVGAVMVGLMTWVLMPRVTRLAAGWLFPPA